MLFCRLTKNSYARHKGEEPDVARVILRIRDAKGESEAEAALGRLAALPDIQDAA